MLKLYYVPKTRAMRPRWLLEELGVPYELVRMDASKRETHTESYLHVNPLGHVPALDDGGTVIVESAAIIMYLADKYPEKGLAPAAGTPERGRWYQWILYAMATLEPLVGLVSEQGRLAPEERSEPLANRMKARFVKESALAEQHLQGREFALDRFTAADVVLGSVLGWARMIGMCDERPHCAAYAKVMLARPAAKKARED
ncbi:MAG TPA: glutathione S-transferase family protein [Myxococcaceae bacterium]|nr:glutathione S-transferase family protein [Myxococcaceae bacterium]